MKNNKIKPLIEIAAVIALFIFFSYIIQRNMELFKLLIDNSLISMFIYIFIVIIAVVIAPVSAMPLLPIASNLWGWFTAAILSIIGWTIGALIAFVIARKYGMPLVKKLIPLEKIEHAEALVPKQNIFWSIVFLRMVIPVDILSYTLGLFSKISGKRYVLATIIGVLPFAFVFSYLGKMPFYYQLIALLIALLIFLAGWFIAIKHNPKNKSQKKITVSVYFWGGQKFGIKIKSTCKECDLTIPLIKNLIKKEFKGKLIKVEIKPWLNNIFKVFFKYRGWHAPIIVVNDRFISQGKVVNVKALRETIKEELRT